MDEITVNRQTSIAVNIEGHVHILTMPRAIALHDRLGAAIRHRHDRFLETIKRIVCEAFKVSVVDIDDRGRTDDVCRPRHAFFWLARQEGFSFAAIGKACGGRDHGTVMHGCSVMEERITTDRELRAAMTYLRGQIGALRQGEISATCTNKPEENA